MKTFKIILIIPLFILLLGSQCRKDLKNTLPPITQIGAGTFGCLVDGQLYRDGNVSFYSPSLIIVLQPSKNNTLILDAMNNYGNSRKSVGFTINNMTSIGKYYLTGQNNGIFWDVNSNLNITSFCKFQTDSLDQTGYVNITYFDTIQKVVSGIFSFKAKLFQSSAGTCDSTHIYNVTEGRFDASYTKR